MPESPLYAFLANHWIHINFMCALSRKLQSKAADCLRKISDKSFDQETLESLLIAIREASPKSSSTREMADFVAHADRDRGLVFEHLATFKIAGIQTKEGRRVCIYPSNSIDGYILIDDLASTVRALGLDGKAIDDNRQ